MTSAQCIFGTEKYPDCAKLFYDDDDYSQGYGQIKKTFRASTKDDIFKTYISDNDFRSTNVSVAGEDDSTIGYYFYVPDIR